MECDRYFPSVLTVDHFFGRGGGPLERQKQGGHVYRKTGTLPLICRKNQNRHCINDEVWKTVKKVWNSLRVMDANMNNTMRQCSRRCSDRRVEVWGRCIDWKLMVLHNTYEQISIAGSHFGPYGYAISLFVMVAAEWKAIECYGTSSARWSSVSALG